MVTNFQFPVLLSLPSLVLPSQHSTFSFLGFSVIIFYYCPVVKRASVFTQPCSWHTCLATNCHALQIAFHHFSFFLLTDDHMRIMWGTKLGLQSFSTEAEDTQMIRGSSQVIIKLGRPETIKASGCLSCGSLGTFTSSEALPLHAPQVCCLTARTYVNRYVLL